MDVLPSRSQVVTYCGYCGRPAENARWLKWMIPGKRRVRMVRIPLCINCANLWHSSTRSQRSSAASRRPGKN